MLLLLTMNCVINFITPITTCARFYISSLFSLFFLSCMKTIFQDICSSSSVTPESMKNLRDSLKTFAPG